jgi:hypothetical protein
LKFFTGISKQLIACAIFMIYLLQRWYIKQALLLFNFQLQQHAAFVMKLPARAKKIFSLAVVVHQSPKL